VPTSLENALTANEVFTQPLRESEASCCQSGNYFGFSDLISHPNLQTERNPEPAMNVDVADKVEAIDRKTSRSIRDAVGERLQRDLRPDYSGLSTYLQSLMDELRKRDVEGRFAGKFEERSR
jgi:hypothetical protein